MTLIVPPYTYAAIVVNGKDERTGKPTPPVHDGDNVHLDVDHGRQIWHRGDSYRLNGVNLIELKDPGGKEALAYVSSLLPLGLRVLVTTIKPDKYGGRWQARIIVDPIGDISDHLIAEGWAAPWDGRGKKPVPAWPRQKDPTR